MKTKPQRIENAREFPKVYYGLHFYPGVAEYSPAGQKPYRIYVTEDAIRKMQPTFAGKPLYVRHVNEVSLPTLEDDMDGVVVKSFFNKADGKHWTQFVVTTDKGHAAIRNGWKLSNCYLPEAKGGKGIHNGLEYDEELLDGKYEHLALVNDPRYEESVIYTPEQFKEYNATKEAELQRLSNSQDKKKKKVSNKGESAMLFKKQAVEESQIDLDDTLVVLPKSKKEVSLANAIEMADRLENMHGYANADHMVKVGEEEMSVGKLTKNYLKYKANESDDEDGDKKENDADEKDEPEMKNKKKNAKKKNKADDEDEEDKPKKNAKKKNSRDDDEDEDEEDLVIENSSDDDEDDDEDEDEEEKTSRKKNSRKDDDEDEEDEKEGNFHRLLNAGDKDNVEDEEIEMSHTRLARGKDRY